MITWILKNIIGIDFFNFIQKSVRSDDTVSSKRMTAGWLSLLLGAVVYVGVRQIYRGHDITDNYLLFLLIMVVSLLSAAGIVLLENINVDNLIKTIKNKKPNDSDSKENI